MSRGGLRRWWQRLLGRSDRDEPAARDWAQLQDLLSRAIQYPVDERERLLERVCADAHLRREVESLLAAHDAVGPVDRLARELPLLAREGEVEAGSVIGHYEVREPLGAGGMGVVYQAYDTRLGRNVALKFLPRQLGLDDSAKQRFLLEAQAAAALDHPNICTIHEIGEGAGGQLFISMPCYSGETLKDRIARGALPVEEALDVAIQVAHGLEKAHQHGIIHRDIKPANLMRTDEGLVKILDFGLAKTTDVSLASGGLIMGTAPYMSPEQAGGEAVDHRTDLWSLGVVLYEMVSGRLPFEGGRVEVVVASILTDEPQPPLASTPGGLLVNRIATRLLAKCAADRWGTAGELARALDEAAAAVRGVVAPNRIVHAVDPAPADTIPPDGERRHATVIVAHLTGYSTVLERVTSLALESLVTGLRETTQEIVTRHGGVVNRFSGEELVCLFGVPTAREDDCVRAVRAAVELRARLPEGWSSGVGDDGAALGVRTGVSQGVLAVQRSTARDGTFAIAGTPLDLASHLASHAAPGEILMSPDGHRLVGPFFETDVADDVSVPGRAAPLAPHRVIRETGLTTRIEAAARAGLTEFVGRGQELTVLREGLTRASQGAGRLVTVIGEAGVGKSRLLYEFTHSFDHGQVRVLRSRFPASQAGPPYQPFVAALRDLLDLGSLPSPVLDAETVVQRILGVSAELEEFVPVYLHLLAVPSERHELPPHLRGERLRPTIRDALAAAVTLGATERPVGLLLEDWHWADDASHEALQHLAEIVPGYPILVVVTYRPGHRVAWAESTPHTTINLGPLSVEGSERILSSMLGGEMGYADVEAIHERAGGNPFFLEELCHALREEGFLRCEAGRIGLAGSIDEVDLPATVQGVIRTRLDRLDAEPREVARVASVVGRDFAVPVLERVLGPSMPLERSLQRLKELGLVHRVRAPQPTAYRFKHVLTQEVAYDTLLQHQRRTLHGRVGEAIEAVYPDRVTEQADRLALHFSLAEDWPRAVHHGREAARKAESLSEFAGALETLERVADWTLKLRDDGVRHDALVDVLLRQEHVCEILGQRRRQQEIIAQLIMLLEPEGDSAQLAEVYRRQGDLYVLTRQFDRARSAIERSLEVSRALGDGKGERNGLNSLGLACWQEGKLADALRHVERALIMGRASNDEEAVKGDLVNVGQILRRMGDHDHALAALEEALGYCARSGDRDVVNADNLYHLIGMVYQAKGDLPRALEYMERARATTEKASDPIRLGYLLGSIARVRFEQGAVEEALQLYGEGVRIGRQGGHLEGLSQSLRILGELLVGLGRDVEALPHLQEAAQTFAQLQDRQAEATMWMRIAGVFERAARYADAEIAWSKLRELSRRTRNARGEVCALDGLARAARQGRRDLDGARDMLDQALDLVVDLQDPVREAGLRNAAGIVAWHRGAYAEALGHYERALALFRDQHDAPGIALSLNSIGVTLVRLGRREDGRTRLEEAVDFASGAGERLLEGQGLAALGDVHYDAGAIAEAERCYRLSLALRREIGDRRGEGWMLERLGRASGLRQDFAGATRYSQEAREIAEAVGDDELLKTCRTSGSHE